MHPARTMLICMLLALISAFLWSMPVFGHPATDNDAMIYDAVGRSIAAGDGLVYRGSLPPVEPLYPLFVGLIYGVAGPSPDAVRVIQAFMLAGSIGFLYLTARRLMSERMAMVSAAAAALFWGLASLAGALMPTALLVFLITFLGYVAVRAITEQSIRWLLLVGFSCALLSLSLSVFLPLIGVWCIAYWFTERADLSRRARMRSCVVAILAFIATMTPWWMYAATRTDYGVTSRVGYTLHLKAEASREAARQPWGHITGHLLGYYIAQGLWPDIDPYGTRGAPETEAWFAEMERSGTDYRTIDRRMREKALLLIREQPEGLVVMTVLNFLNFNSPVIPRPEDLQNQVIAHPLFAVGGYTSVPWPIKAGIVLWIRVLWWAGAVAVIIGFRTLVRSSNARKGAIILGGVILYFQIAFSVIHAIPRHALPLYPWYFLFVTVGISTLWCRIPRFRNPLINR